MRSAAVPGRSLTDREVAELAMREVAHMRTVIELWLLDNDPEGFGCACTSAWLCGPCRERKRQEPLRRLVQRR